MKKIALLVLLLASLNPAYANVRLPNLLSDHMILQRDVNLKIWGWADPGESVTVTLKDQTKTTQADKSGNWELILQPLAAGGPFQLTVKGKNALVLKDILVGDVWVASGQSNMEWTMAACKDRYQTDIANSANPQIRLLDVKNKISYLPQIDILTEGWQEASPEHTPRFSAVGYFFARDLYEQYKVPIGIITSEWGGTPAEAWTSLETIKTLPDFKSSLEMVVQKQSTEDPAQNYQIQVANWFAAIRKLDKGFHSDGKTWADENLADRTLKIMPIPGVWENAGLANMDGIVWFRKEIQVSAADAGKELTLLLGPIDDADTTYFNGAKVGYTNDYSAERKYKVPGNLVKAGRNVIAVRVLDTGGGGGIWGKPEAMQAQTNSQTIALAGEWKFNVGVTDKELPKNPTSMGSAGQPTVLYNGMIAPLLAYAIKGVIWYQGENNAPRAYQYRTLFPAMIKDWRTKWGIGDFPFLFVQLANYMPAVDKPGESDWAELREAQLKTLAVPNTGMAVTIDIGEAADIHPKNKLDVGKRLALAARKVAYKEKNVVYAGPVFESMKTAGQTLQLTFTNTGGGLVAKGGELKGFAVAGADKQFVWAKARIENNKVIVWSDQVPSPVSVRYAWANNPEGCNLYNQEGLPATPFRSDNWPGITLQAR